MSILNVFKKLKNNNKAILNLLRTYSKPIKNKLIKSPTCLIKRPSIDNEKHHVSYIHNDIIKRRNFEDIHGICICPFIEYNADKYVNQYYLTKKIINSIINDSNTSILQFNAYNELNIREIDRIFGNFISYNINEKNKIKTINIKTNLIKYIKKEIKYYKVKNPKKKYYLYNLNNHFNNLDIYLFFCITNKSRKSIKKKSIRINVIMNRSNYFKLNSKQINLLYDICLNISEYFNIIIDGSYEHVCIYVNIYIFIKNVFIFYLKYNKKYVKIYLIYLV